MKNSVALTVWVGVMGLGAFVTGVTMADASPKSQWDGAYTATQAHRGESLYSQYCTMCHGPDLLGGEMAPPLIGGTFQANWNELTLGDLFDRIRISMPQNAPGSLSRQQYADILSYLLSKDGYPAGQSELPPQTEALKETKYLSTKP
jgi:S-disulfanyl-L-cysteine oxidoreductase SoxD